MEQTLIINPGSSSKKYAIYEGDTRILTVRFERTKDGFGRCVSAGSERMTCEEVREREYKDALIEVIEIVKENGIITSTDQLTTVGVRIVAPGTFFTEHRSVNDTYIEKLSEKVEIAPLHIPHILEEIQMVRTHLPSATIIGVSDSAFHTTIPSYLSTYSLKGTKEHDIRRFGYHGLSVSSVAGRFSDIFETIPKRTVVCHIGSGVSVTALCDGASIDTTMGFTPASGLMMGSRAADMDPGALLYTIKREGLSGAAAQKFINSEGGFRGLIGTADLRTVLDRMARGDVFAKEALQGFIVGLQKAVGAAAAVLEGLDAIVLTATAMERNPDLRYLLLRELSFLGIQIDQKINDACIDGDGIITKETNKVAVAVMKTDEMGEMNRIIRTINA